MHMGHVGPSSKKGLKWGLVTHPRTNCPIHGIYDSHKCVSPKEIRCIGIFHDGPALIKNPLIGPLSDAVLFWGVGYSEFECDPIFCAVLLQHSIDIFATSIGLKNFCMSPIVVMEEFVELGEPCSEVRLE